MALNFSVPDSELTATLHNRRNRVVDQVYQGRAFWNAMTSKGGLKMEGGGKELITPLRMSKATAGGSFSGYDLLDTTPQDNETSARFPWAYEYQTVAVAWTEEMENMGPGRLINWVEMKTDDAMMAIVDRANTKLMATQPAAGSKDVISLTELIDDDPTGEPPRAASIGNIANSNTWWRNSVTTGGAFSVADWNTKWNDCSDGEEDPTFLLTSQTIYEYYENSLTGLIRYGDVSNRTGDQGFERLLFKKAPVIWDPQIGLTDNVYFINTNYLKIVIHTNGDFKTGEFKEPDNQAAKVAKILLAFQLECTNRRRCGAVIDITAPA